MRWSACTAERSEAKHDCHTYGIPARYALAVSDFPNPDFAGKTLQDVNPALFAETTRALLGGGISPSCASLNEEEAHIVARKLAAARIRARCDCKQDDCCSYSFEVPQKPKGSAHYSTVRFYSRGEHLLHIDSDGDVYKAERLYDRSGAAAVRYVRQLDGSWASR